MNLRERLFDRLDKLSDKLGEKKLFRIVLGVNVAVTAWSSYWVVQNWMADSKSGLVINSFVLGTNVMMLLEMRRTIVRSRRDRERDEREKERIKRDLDERIALNAHRRSQIRARLLAAHPTRDDYDA